jgi:hypothetical protein
MHVKKKLMYVEKHLELGFRKRTSAVWVWLSGSRYPAVFRNAFWESLFFAHGLFSNVLGGHTAELFW